MRRHAPPPGSPLSSLHRDPLGRYRIRSSIKLVHPATRDRWPPVFNLVEVEPHTVAHESIGTGPTFADFVTRDFDMTQVQVAYVSDEDSQLLAVVSDAARDAIRDGELRITGCAFQAADVEGTTRQLARIIKYVQRGFRLPAGSLPPAPQALIDEPRGTNLRTRVSWLLKGRLHSELSTPARTAAPGRRPQILLLLKFARADGGAWRVAPAQQLASAARNRAAPTAV